MSLSALGEVNNFLSSDDATCKLRPKTGTLAWHPSFKKYPALVLFCSKLYRVRQHHDAAMHPANGQPLPAPVRWNWDIENDLTFSMASRHPGDATFRTHPEVAPKVEPENGPIWDSTLNGQWDVAFGVFLDSIDIPVPMIKESESSH